MGKPHTRIYRLVHVDTLETYLCRGELHAALHAPTDGFAYRGIHRGDVQSGRERRGVPCGAGGCLLDYVPFYFSPRSPMLYQLQTGWVRGYTEGKEPLVHLVAYVEKIVAAGYSFVLTDGHALSQASRFSADLEALDRVDWEVVRSSVWNDTLADPDRQRRKQAEFLVHRSLAWNLIEGIGVACETTERRVSAMLQAHANRRHPRVAVKPEWYYADR